MSGFDLTVALTAHAETVIAGPTMASAEGAIAAAEEGGITVERIIGFDTPTDECRAYFSAPAFSHWKQYDFAFRDQGQTRNALAEVAQGRWLAFLDGDDLFSENWLVEAIRCLRGTDDERAIIHPELNIIFDAGEFTFTKPVQSDPLFTPYYFYFSNYYDALCVAARDAWLDHPYAHRAIRNGFAYEDWQWNIETMAAGWRHIVAQNTIIFKRRRDISQTHESLNNTANIRQLDAMAIDRVSRLATIRRHTLSAF